MSTEAEMMADLAAADAAGDSQLAQAIVGKIKALKVAPVEPPSRMDAFSAGATRGVGDRVLSRADALKAQGSKMPEERSMVSQLAGVPQGPQIDEQRFQGDALRNLGQRRAKGAEAEKAHPGFYLGGQLVPAAASVLVPGASGIGGAAAVGGALGLAGSEADTAQGLATDASLGGALGGSGAALLKALGLGARAIGRKLLPKAEGVRDAITNQIADKSAAAAEATARSAQGTAGAARANASRTVERLGMDTALPEAEVLANKAAAGTPEAQKLASELAQRARGELPEKLAHMEGAQALADQAVADAAASRSPEAVAAMEKQLRSEVGKRLLTRYLAPAAVGYGVGELAGGHGTLGAAAGFGARPMLRATVRGFASPGFTAPMSRAAVSAAEWLAAPSGAAAARLGPLAEGAEPKLLELLRALQEQKRLQLASNGGQQ